MHASLSLGDLVRAATDLAPLDAEALEAIVECLQLPRANAALAPVRPAAWRPSAAPPALVRAPATFAPRTPWGRLLKGGGPARAQASSAGRTLVTPVHDARSVHATPAPEWLSAGEVLGPPPADEVVPESTVPLFGPTTQRGILGALLATRAPGSALDVKRIVRVLAEARPLESLPRLSLLTLRRGVQVLVDQGGAMDPYRPDVAGLLENLDALFPDDRLAILPFVGCPSRGVWSASKGRWLAWPPPPADTPVLVVSDLGIGGSFLDEGRATTTEWLKFGRRVATVGHPLLALVPYEPRRWPAALVRHMTLIPWSERTTAGSVRRSLREARRGTGR